MNKLLIPVLLLCSSVLFGQVRPEYFPDDVDANTTSSSIRCFCKPGVRNKSRSRGLELSYNFIGRGTYEPESTPAASSPLSKYSNWQNFRFSINAPILNKPGLKLLVGYRYGMEAFAFSQFGADFRETFEVMDRKLLKSNSLSLLFTKSFNDKHYFSVRLRNSTNGNYSGLVLYNERYNIHKALAMFGVKRSEDIEWGVGLNLSSGFRRRTSILPFVLYNRNFNEKWAIETALPAYIYLRRNLDPETLLLLGIEYNGQSYRLDVPNASAPLDYAFNHSEILGSIQLERQVTGWLWFSIDLGYQYNFSSDYEPKSDNSPEFKVEPTNAPFLRLGLFLSPPAHFSK